MTTAVSGASMRIFEIQPKRLRHAYTDMPEQTSSYDYSSDRPLASLDQFKNLAANLAKVLELNHPVSAITCSTKTWPDGALGLSNEGEASTLAQVPGWEVEIAGAATSQKTKEAYRANLNGTHIREVSEDPALGRGRIWKADDNGDMVLVG